MPKDPQIHNIHTFFHRKYGDLESKERKLLHRNAFRKALAQREKYRMRKYPVKAILMKIFRRGKALLSGSKAFKERIGNFEKNGKGAKRFIGLQGIAITKLGSHGKVKVLGETLDAYTNGRMILPKEKIRVVDVQYRHLVVEPMKNTP